MILDLAVDLEALRYGVPIGERGGTEYLVHSRQNDGAEAAVVAVGSEIHLLVCVRLEFRIAHSTESAQVIVGVVQLLVGGDDLLGEGSARKVAVQSDGEIHVHGVGVVLRRATDREGEYVVYLAVGNLYGILEVLGISRADAAVVQGVGEILRTHLLTGVNIYVRVILRRGNVHPGLYGIGTADGRLKLHIYHVARILDGHGIYRQVLEGNAILVEIASSSVLGVHFLGPMDVDDDIALVVGCHVGVGVIYVALV